MQGSSIRRRSPRYSPRTKYTGARQPHKSRRGRILNSKGAPATESHEVPGPGAYQIDKIRIRSPRSPRCSFGNSTRFRKKRSDVSKYGTPVPLIIRPALGEQILSTRRTLGSALFGKGTRAAANISATRVGVPGMDSPGPIYNPQETTRDAEKRCGLRPEFSARRRMIDFQSSISSLGSNKSVRSLKRPSTSAAMSASMIRERLDAEVANDLGYTRPGTSFGRSRRPPLYSKDKGSNPGPKYEHINARALSTEPTLPSAKFGTSTRDQRRKMRGIVDNDGFGQASPGPGAYFTGGPQSVEIAEKNTESSFGPSFSIRVRTPIALSSGGNRNDTKYDKRSRPSQEERSRWVKPLRASMGRQVEGTRRTSPMQSVGLSPRFGNVHGFSAGRR
jgi:hypothetical protein